MSGAAVVLRSKSTAKSRSHRDEENPYIPPIRSPRIPKSPQLEKRDPYLVKNFQTKSAKSTPTSPSPWALSPGRALPCSPAPVKSPSSRRLKVELSGGRVSGVLKYFRQRKVSPVQGEEFHRLRMLHNRLLQWRFANARARASGVALKVVAEEKLFNVWLRTLILRNSVLEKSIERQRLEHEIKLYKIINPQICLLKDWARMDKQNPEALGRLTTKLSAISVRLPLVRGAQADWFSAHEAVEAAIGLMEMMEILATEFLPQVEKMCFLTTELIVMEKQQKECMEELEKWVSAVASLEVRERSLRAHLVQVANGVGEGQLTGMIG
ncbi:hypothetical protein NMG60_11012214 [Bertholletia excelsa]